MELFQRRRSKITCLTSDLLQPAFREGKRQVQYKGNFPKLASDSSSCSSDITDNDMSMFEFEKRSSKQAVRTPMKKLLAKEMSKETESKRRSPSVIARLMGLEGLPATQDSYKQQNISAENYQPCKASIEKAQRKVASSGHQSFRTSSNEEQEFKDVFEVLDASKIETCSSSLQEIANSKLSEAEMVFIRQKFMEAKRLSSDERFQESKEFQDALEELDSNKDLLLKFLQQPDSLFAKHLHDLGASPLPHCAHLSAMTPSNARKCKGSDLSWKAEKETQRKNNFKSSHKHLGSHSGHPSWEQTVQSLSSPIIVQSEGKEEHAVLPTRIVVLKPNLGRLQTGSRIVSSPRSSHAYSPDSGMDAELNNRDTGTGQNKIFPDNAGLSRHKSRESREIASQLRDNLNSGSVKFSNARRKGYAGDESSSNISGNESSYELELKTVSSKVGFVRHRRARSALSHFSETSVSREAKKRLSERWKMSHTSEKWGVTNNSSMLGAMLVMSDREVRPASVDTTIGQEGISDKCDGKRPKGWIEPLGISSSDGWKDGSNKKLMRSRSLPACSTLRSTNTSKRYEYLLDDRYMISKETSKCSKGKTMKGNFNLTSSRNSRSTHKKCLSSQRTSRESNVTSPDTDFTDYQLESDLKKDDPYEESFMVPQSSPSIVSGTNSVPKNVLDMEHDDKLISSGSPNSEFSAPLLLCGDSTTGDLGIFSSKEPLDGPSKEVPFHQPRSEIGLPASSMETDQPSPISILETPFLDDLSCAPECFGSISADLHGLQRQLELLKLDKLESEAYTEGTMVISSDEDVEERSVRLIDESSILSAEENWDHSYIADVLIHAGFNDINPDTITTTFVSPECPVSPWLFEELEKKYINLTSLSRSERKLMFDCVNGQLLQIHQQLVDPHPWLRTAVRVTPKWNENGLQDNLHALLMSQRKKGNKDTCEKVLAKEAQWLDIGDDIDVIGKEIETLLIDELVADVGAM